jgi:hypothetical protein
MPSVRVYHPETPEPMFGAHDKAFDFASLSSEQEALPFIQPA